MMMSFGAPNSLQFLINEALNVAGVLCYLLDYILPGSILDRGDNLLLSVGFVPVCWIWPYEVSGLGGEGFFPCDGYGA